MRRRAAEVPASVRAAIRAAASNIRLVSKRQVPKGWRVRVTAGVTVEQRVVPLDRVGCYVPGGRYPLPSSLLMTAIPARAADRKSTRLNSSHSQISYAVFCLKKKKKKKKKE